LPFGKLAQCRNLWFNIAVAFATFASASVNVFCGYAFAFAFATAASAFATLFSSISGAATLL